MAVYSVHSEPLLTHYKTYLCSKPSLIFLICTLLTFISPLLIAYRSEGFWKKTDYYLEQPDVHFKREFIVLLQMSREIEFVAWSSYANFNQLMEGHVQIPVIKFREQDTNRDGINDVLDISFQFFLKSQSVQSVTLLLFFDYQLSKFCRLEMESLAYIWGSSPIDGLEYRIIGDLTLEQRIPLAHAGIDTQYNVSIVNSDSVYARDYDLGDILKSYSDRNVTTILKNVYPVWKTIRGSEQPFVINATIRYSGQVILYNTGFWQLMKWAWIQYFSFLLVFIYLFYTIKTFIFKNQIIPTMVQRPIKIHSS